MIVCLSGCVYNPPEGYTENHHTYEAISAFASAIDPQAIVSEEYHERWALLESELSIMD